LPGHRSAPRAHSPHGLGNDGHPLRPGEAVLQRPLEHYEQVGRALAQLHGGRIS